ncbi:MBL fold metallo-hydrolase [Lacihabitans sp. CS3-21]|uniref:MBL fold metallo-hydrolase n=1 Tax=Lacihabitans sp. CS3-21 TaxID=2487332 RepID=UPI0020CC5C21|nr:MBL fold metallo-hydrolase [Lacihabitans sp. CS3-21]MCP9748432.1 MBL fold metallo-hydrolase [Lacihabitans sp. CS3-21]
MKITFLGTGTSTGVPVLTCKCEVCRSLDFRDKRLRVSVLIQNNDKNIVIDSGPDFRQQALRENLQSLEALVFTHEHKDHTGGLDDVRPFNYLSGIKNCPIYAHPRVLSQLKMEYFYAFTEKPYPGVPIITCNEIDTEPFERAGLKFIPIQVLHHKLPVLGFRIGDFAYITDANYISEEELMKVYGCKVLVLNALQHEPHISHFNLNEAIALSQKIGAEKTYFTHISHKLGLHREVEKDLPANISLAYDGLSFSL